MDGYSQADETANYIRTICMDFEEQGLRAEPFMDAIEWLQQASPVLKNFRHMHEYYMTLPAYAREAAEGVLSASNIEPVSREELPF